MIRTPGRTWLAVVFLGVVGCSGGRLPITVLDSGEDMMEVVPDAQESESDVGSDLTETADVHEPDMLLDVSWPDASEDTSDVEMPPCEGNEDCFSGICIETPAGKRCSQPCVTDAGCPGDLVCAPTSFGGADVAYACVHPTPRICRPCQVDADCAYSLSTIPMVCAAVDFLHFCLPGCAVSFCPKGYTCGQSDGQAVCIPNSGQCACTILGEGAMGACDQVNESGACQGTFACEDGLITDCDAKTPAPESCNYEDDDCNGKVDDDVVSVPCVLENSYGSCAGRTLCVAGETFCQGDAPVQEMCNGVDDDCDGLVDEPGSVGCREYYRDVDGDTFGLATDHRCLCSPVQPHSAMRIGDCDDSDAGVNPDRLEACNDFDDNCNSRIDEGCDDDQDGYCDMTMTVGGTGPVASCPNGMGDCDDTNGDRFPGNSVCGMDGDCDFLPKDVGEACDDQNWLDFDGCHICEMTETMIGTFSAANQLHPRAAIFPNGRSVITFLTLKQYSVNQADVAARLFDAQHVGDGPEFRVSSSPLSTVLKGHAPPSVAVLPSEGFVVVWWNGHSDSVLMRRFAAAGVAVDAAEVKVADVVQQVGMVPMASVTSWPDGRFVVGFNGDSIGVQARLYASDGAAQSVIPISVSQDAAVSPRLQVLDSGFVAAWATASGVFMRRFDDDGKPVDAGDVQVNTDSVGMKLTPMLSTFPDGRIVVAWKNRSLDPQHAGIYARVFSTDGQPQTTSEIPLSTDPFPSYLVLSDATTPDLGTIAMATSSMMGDDEIVLAWSGFPEGLVTYQVLASRYGLDGTRSGTPVKIDHHAWFLDFSIDLQRDHTGFVATWFGSSDPTFVQQDVVMQPLNPDGTRRYR